VLAEERARNEAAAKRREEARAKREEERRQRESEERRRQEEARVRLLAERKSREDRRAEEGRFSPVERPSSAGSLQSGGSRPSSEGSMHSASSGRSTPSSRPTSPALPPAARATSTGSVYREGQHGLTDSLSPPARDVSQRELSAAGQGADAASRLPALSVGVSPGNAARSASVLAEERARNEAAEESRKEVREMREEERRQRESEERRRQEEARVRLLAERKSREDRRAEEGRFSPVEQPSSAGSLQFGGSRPNRPSAVPSLNSPARRDTPHRELSPAGQAADASQGHAPRSPSSLQPLQGTEEASEIVGSTDMCEPCAAHSKVPVPRSS